MDNIRPLEENFRMAQLEVANAQNARLIQENTLLRQKLDTLIAEKQSNSSVHIEAKLKAFKLEEERDRIYEKLEKIKVKHNQLHEAYLQKVKRCKALEDVFQRQKTLNGLVMKSAIDQTHREHEVVAETRESIEAHLAKLQTALNEAYDIIDELEFELESVDFLEVENQRLRNELQSHKKDKYVLLGASNPIEKIEIVDESFNELPAYRQSHEVSARHQFDSNVSSLADSIVGDLDPAVTERSVLTESLIKIAESESNCLRRELLRSRLQKTARPIAKPPSSDA